MVKRIALYTVANMKKYITSGVASIVIPSIEGNCGAIAGPTTDITRSTHANESPTISKPAKQTHLWIVVLIFC